ncbi:MAG: acyl-CoA reductase [Bacteroidetes bacterium]|nr:acyl-CoA reductase [Bacteroidota bacterium]HET6243646.1 acyl-CoA reductase [Bacteroidia bacterium]
MNLIVNIKAFSRLGGFLTQFLEEFSSEESASEYEFLNEMFKERLENAIQQSINYNGWFTQDNVKYALTSIANNLTYAKLSAWLLPYTESLEKNTGPGKIAVVMAGNIPLSGFHDFMCVLISGNTFIGKLSSQDKLLLPLLSDVLIEIETSFKSRIVFTEGRITSMDAVIATGSNNTSRYFDYYFGKYPNIIRRNRNSVAILTGKESELDIFNLGNDVFRYFGLGCRNVTKLFVPRNYDFDVFFRAIYDFQWIANNNKYINNYHYNKTVYLMGNENLLDNGFMILKEDKTKSSPVGVLFYEYYDSLEEIEKTLESELLSEVQCVVSNKMAKLPTVEFGAAQLPGLDDYADGIDTIQFLANLIEK